MSDNDISKLKLPQLKAIAKELNIVVPKGVKKDELIELIQKGNDTQDKNNSNEEKQPNSKKDSKTKEFKNVRNRNFSKSKKDDKEEKDAESKEENRGENQKETFSEVQGLLDVRESHGFIRTKGYLPTENDAYVPMNVIRKFNLRAGDYIKAVVKNNSVKNPQKQKYLPIFDIIEVEGKDPALVQNRVDFNKLTPLYPNERLRLETTDPKKITERLIDIVSPIGKGQRGLIVAPPKAGKTIILQKIANAIKSNNPEVHLMVVLVDERPEEVTDMERSVDGEVISSTFDRQPFDHTVIAELAIERAKRLVEKGKDVVILLDSITRLSRAYNLAQPVTGRVLSGGVDAGALYPPKKFFGAARNIENGGSLTIIATALVETGSKMDEVIFEEFKGTGNLELKLSRELSNRRIFPSVDINASGTRREEMLMREEEVALIFTLRNILGGQELEQASNMVLNGLKDTSSNAEFLMRLKQNKGHSPF